jgi:hypothetical protein
VKAKPWNVIRSREFDEATKEARRNITESLKPFVSSRTGAAKAVEIAQKRLVNRDAFIAAVLRFERNEDEISKLPHPRYGQEEITSVVVLEIETWRGYFKIDKQSRTAEGLLALENASPAKALEELLKIIHTKQ